MYLTVFLFFFLFCSGSKVWGWNVCVCVFFFKELSLLFSQKPHLFKLKYSKNSNIVKNYYNLKVRVFYFNIL